MRIYNNIAEFNAPKNAVVTIGTYDGVHLGHKKILKRLTDEAKRIDGESVVLTFFPHPRMIINPEDAGLKLINTITEKALLLEGLGVDHMIVTPFSRDFSNMCPAEYAEEVLFKKLGAKALIIGYDHKFGKNRAGDVELLRKLGDERGVLVEEISEEEICDASLSSTTVRKALLRGDVDLAARCLGYAYNLHGRIIKGDKIGRTIGFPTANIHVEEPYKLIPADGIYAVQVVLEEDPYRTYYGMAYIGHRPTINGMTRNIEVNIFDFNAEVYGQRITVYFMHYLRGDEKFESLQVMAAQLERDKMDTLKFFEKNK